MTLGWSAGNDRGGLAKVNTTSFSALPEPGKKKYLKKVMAEVRPRRGGVSWLKVN